MNNLFKGAALFVGGALAGAAIVLLLPPEKREEIREQLTDLVDEAKKRAQEYCEQVKQHIEKEAADGE